jgi:hypothetical protein
MSLAVCCSDHYQLSQFRGHPVFFFVDCLCFIPLYSVQTTEYNRIIMEPRKFPSDPVFFFVDYLCFIPLYSVVGTEYNGIKQR